MAFDPSTARPINSENMAPTAAPSAGRFDPSTARPVREESDPETQPPTTESPVAPTALSTANQPQKTPWYADVDYVGQSTQMRDEENRAGYEVFGEMASGGNEAILAGLDVPSKFVNKAISGYAGLANLAATGDIDSAVQMERDMYNARPVPTVNDLLDSLMTEMGVEMRPGDRVMPSSTMQKIVRGAGGIAAPLTMGVAPVLGRDVTKPAGMMAEALGFGSAKAPPLTPQAFNHLEAGPSKSLTTVDDAPLSTVEDYSPTPVGSPKPTQMDSELALLRGDSDISTTGFVLDDAGNVVRTAADKPVIKQGWTDGFVAALKTGSAATRAKVRKMVDFVDKGIRNDNFKSGNPPGNVVGEAMNNRLKIIRSAFMRSKDDLDVAAGNLDGRPIDLTEASTVLLTDLKKHGIKVEIDPTTGAMKLDENGKVDIDFSRSTVRGLPSAEGFVQRLLDYIHESPADFNALDAHHAKRFIDHNVSYGRQVDGLPGAMETIAKRLRHNIDTVLDTMSPEYDAANTMYADTVRVIDEIQGHAGGKVDLMEDTAELALGTMSRKLLSNYQAQAPIKDTVKRLDAVALKYAEQMGVNPAVLGDDIGNLVSAEAAIRNTIPGVAKASSLQGILGAEIGKVSATMDVAEAATGSPVGVLRAAANLTKKDPQSTEVKLKQLEALRKWLNDFDSPTQQP